MWSVLALSASTSNNWTFLQASEPPAFQEAEAGTERSPGLNRVLPGSGQSSKVQAGIRLAKGFLSLNRGTQLLIYDSSVQSNWLEKV